MGEMDKQYSIGITGGGAVGLTYAALLSVAADVLVVTRRQQQVDAINAQGISFKHRSGEAETFKDVRASTDFAGLKDCDAVIICVKTYDTEDVANKLNEAVGPDTTVLTLQNGLTSHNVLRRILSNPDRVMAGVSYVGASREDDRTVVNGPNLITVVDPKAERLIEIMRSTQLEVQAPDNIKQAVWDKAAMSVGQNALSAVTNRNYGQMLASPDCLDIAAKLLDEFEQVAKAEGLSFSTPLMDRLRDNWKGSTFYPSMWQDLQKGRRTEIDAINGAISHFGQTHNIPTPYNDMITSLIRALEK
jgi:2-dehydropantoate 2-reductase